MFRDILLADLDRSLTALRGHWLDSSSYGNVESCHGVDISWYEMFCRSAYGVLAYTTATGKNDYIISYKQRLLDVFTDKKYTNFKDYDQKAVELAPIAILLYYKRELTWDTYNQQEKELFVDYLDNINKIALCQNNWVFFRIIVNSVLQVLAGKDYTKKIKQDWEFIDKCYDGDGWYRDGLDGCKDNYTPFGFHFYSLLYLFLFHGKIDESRQNTISERAKAFAKQYLYMFDAEGRCVAYGRSLIYRFANLSFWSVLFLNNICDKSEEKTYAQVVAKSYQWWGKQDIFEKDGEYNLGYSYSNTYICENYNSSGSVYWAFKFFLILLIDKESQLWNYLDVPEKDIYYTDSSILANKDIIVQQCGNYNIAYINSYFGSGQTQSFAKYMHFAYNSASGFCLSKDSSNFINLSDDSSLIFKVGGQKICRTKNDAYQVVGDYGQLYKWHWDKLIYVKSLIIPVGSGYLRFHHIHSKIACECYETGFAIEEQNHDQTNKREHNITLSNSAFKSSIETLESKGSLLEIHNEVNTNIYFRHSRMPAVKYRIKPGLNSLSDITSFASTSEENKNNSFSFINGILSVEDGLRHYTVNVKELLSKTPFSRVNPQERKTLVIRIKQIIPPSIKAKIKEVIK